MTITPRMSQASVRIAAAFALTLLAALGLAAAPASAGMGPIAWQATGGWYTNDSDLFLGAGARLGLGTITVIPNAEYVFVNGGAAYTLNVDGTLNVVPLGVATGYVGAGLGLYIIDPDAGDTNTSSTFNLIAGAGLNAIKLKPFAQFKWVLKEDEDPVALVFGVRF